MKKLMQILSGMYLISLPVLALSSDFFVDPSASLNGDGSSPQPASASGGPGAYNSWSGMRFQDNSRYFQRCGTTANITEMIDIRGSNVTVGAYDLNDGDVVINSCTDLPKVRGPGHSLSIAMRIREVTDVVLEYIDIGEARTALSIQAASQFIVRKSRIGAGSKVGISIMGALIGDNYRLTEDGEISENKINSMYTDYHPIDQYQPDLLADGITFKCGVEAVRLKNNEIIDWGHDGVNIHCDANNESPAQNNVINGNKISAQSSPYCRGFSMGGPEGKVQFNTFEDNTVENTSARNQLNGNNNIIRGNAINTVTNNPFKSRAIGQGIHLQAYDNQVCHDNIIENNTITATDDAAIYLYPGDGIKKNNIIRGNTIIDSGLAGGFGDSEQSPIGTAIYVGDSENVVDNIISDNVIRRTGDDMVLRAGDNPEEPALIYFRGRQLTVTEFNAERGTTGTEDDIFNNTFLWGAEEMQALSAPQGLTIN